MSVDPLCARRTYLSKQSGRKIESGQSMYGVVYALTFVKWHNNCLSPLIWYRSLSSCQVIYLCNPLYHCICSMFHHFWSYPNYTCSFTTLNLATAFSTSTLLITLCSHSFSIGFLNHTCDYCFPSCPSIQQTFFQIPFTSSLLLTSIPSSLFILRLTPLTSLFLHLFPK